MPSPLRDQKTPKKGQDTFSNLTKMPGSWTTRSLAGVSREAAAGDGADEHRLRDLGSLASGPGCVGLGKLHHFERLQLPPWGEGGPSSASLPRPRGEKDHAEAQAGAWPVGRSP